MKTFEEVLERMLVDCLEESPRRSRKFAWLQSDGSVYISYETRSSPSSRDHFVVETYAQDYPYCTARGAIRKLRRLWDEEEPR